MSDAQSEALRTRVEDGVLEVTLDRPKANAFNREHKRRTERAIEGDVQRGGRSR
jgi:enoyl-CoA hydratase/carnithine racemase